MTAESIRVLLVDDDRADADLARLRLQDSRLRRFVIEHRETAADALAILRDAAFDVILLDLSLPDSQGIETLEILQREQNDVPVIVLTGLSDESTALQSLEHGAQDYIIKDDASREVLERSICYAMQRRQQGRRLEVMNDRLAQQNGRLEEMNETARDFVDNASHDFRTPLTVIREFASIMQEGLAGPVTAQQTEFLEIILARVDDLAMLVDDMLDVSKVEAGLLGLARQSGHVSDAIGRVQVMLETRAKSKGVRFEIEIAGGLPVVYCDFEKFGRVLVNLAVNAIKFTPAGGRVVLWARRGADERDVEIGLTDEGPGISRDDLEIIFERFEQAGRQAHAGVKGFGLGLSIARELVYLNLGKMHVESEEGRGSTFSFTVPVNNPSWLCERFIKQVSQSAAARGESAHLSLLVAEFPACEEERILHAADGFLQTAVRGRTFVYRCAPHRWVLLVACSDDELREVEQRLLADWNELGENRPDGALPALSLHRSGSWRADTHQDELIAEYTAAMTASPEPGSSARRVLLVDDDEDVTQSLGLRLHAAGYDVLSANDGRRGFDIAKAQQPDVIVLDVRMPRQDGIVTLRELKACDSTNHIPVIMLSASKNEQRLTRELGAKYFIQKPFDARTVLSAIEASLLEAQPV
ncbi:MAG TPA: hybrid sensor histidine kinase/response regulator [Pirellulales bacterium]|nr:hybrid sensor histidine kinase/response regulator [Pirellulales bacterium]